jgi:hypothetical protein
MFDLMGAIRRKQKTQTASPADSAETPQPRALKLAEKLRKPADFSAVDSFSATLRKNPLAPKIGKPASTQGFRVYPQIRRFRSPPKTNRTLTPCW